MPAKSTSEATRTRDPAARSGSSIRRRVSSPPKEGNLNHSTPIYEGLEVVALVVYPGVAVSRIQILEEGEPQL